MKPAILRTWAGVWVREFFPNGTRLAGGCWGLHCGGFGGLAHSEDRRSTERNRQSDLSRYDALVINPSELKTDYDRAEALVQLLVDRATGGPEDEGGFVVLRRYFVLESSLKDLLPVWFESKRNLNQFWQFIKGKFSHYSERKEFLWTEFDPLMKYCEGGVRNAVHKVIDDTLTTFDRESISRAWNKAIERSTREPEGAITSARTLLEAVCKHILDARGLEYDENQTDLPDLYKKVATALSLAPDQHTEGVFKQILGGCSGIVNGLGSLRNKLGDAHGKGVKGIRPLPRHAKLAVNLAGSMAHFLIQTHTGKTD